MSANRKLPLAAAGSASSLRVPASRPLNSAPALKKIQFDGKGQLFIKYISADGPQPAFWEALVRKFAPRSWSCYLAEESCTGLYLTNDTLKRKITADYAIPGRCADGSYTSSLVRRSTFYTQSALRELLSSRYGAGKSMDKLVKLALQDGLPVYEVKREA